MFVPPPPTPDEERRMAELYRLAILDTDPEEEFDDVVRAVSAVCGVPIALVSLVDRERQWFKARVGLELESTSREVSFCGHAVLGPDPMIVPDALEDRRFAGNPLVLGDPRIRFYAGWPLVTDAGAALGTLCAIDTVPRELDAVQTEVMATLARTVVRLMEARRANRELVELLQREEHQHARLIQAATEAANRATTEESAVAEVLDIAVALLDLESGHYWRLDGDHPVLSSVSTGPVEEMFRDPLPVVTDTFRLGRSMRRTDERGGAVLTVPVKVGEATVGVMVVHGGDVSIGERLHLVLDQVGVQIGRAVERERAAVDLAWRADHDLITGLWNRAYLQRRLDEALATSDLLAVLFFDLNRFKTVNDSLGHSVGDLLLIEVARRMAAATRGTDVLARFGGDEFVLLCPRIDDAAEAEQLARRMLETFEPAFDLRGIEVHVDATVGVSVGRRGDEAGTLFAQADAAMYDGKAAGRTVVMADTGSTRERHLRVLDVDSALRAAISQDELLLHYQPIVSTADGRPVAVEALVRWDRPGRGLVRPDEFISVAEYTGLIDRVDSWVRRRAARDLSEWDTAGGWTSGLAVAVNVSARELAAGFARRVTAELGGLPPSRLIIEVTESSLMRGDGQSLTELQALRDAGARIAVDDFGTGFSSLARLRRLPVDVLKIARVFVEPLAGDDASSARAAVRAIADLARAYGAAVVAEGVETEQQWRTLCDEGIDYVQGYYLHRPGPGDQLAPPPYPATAAGPAGAR